MSRPKLLDLFCGAGGCSVGYERAGFDVVGVDINPQPRYPYKFIQADALTFPLHGFDAIHASPPCQAFTRMKVWSNKSHPDLVAATRNRLKTTGKPYIIENVPGAPLLSPLLLCGAMFDLKVYRHRLFESNCLLHPHPRPHPHPHPARPIKAGRPVKEGEVITVVGHFSDVAYAKKAMGIDWMKRDELSQAIPPAYTEFLGSQLLLYC